MAFAVDDLTSVIAHWSADQIAGLSDGDPVDTLPDSISSWDLAGTTTARPLYRPTSSINSLPAVEFDGSNDFMVTATAKTLAISDCVFIFVGNLTGKSYNTPFLLGTVNTSVSYNNFSQMKACSLASYPSPYLYSSPIATTGTSTISYTSADGTFLSDTTYLTSVQMSPLGFNQWRNGLWLGGNVRNAAAINTINDTLYMHMGRSKVGSDTFMDGLISEMVIVDQTVAFERVYIEGVLAHKYGITLPTTHPFYAAAPTSGPPTGGGTAAVHPLGGA
jgi:hypothetical protein